MLSHTLIPVLMLAPSAFSQRVRTDSGAQGSPLEIVHLYNDEWPTGIAVSSAGRKFSNYPAGLDPNNTYTGGDTKYQVAELMFNNTEVPYPSLEINLPPDGALNKSTFPATSVNFADRLIGVQSVVVDSADRLWILDTGRAVDPNTQMLTLAAPGGPKLIGVNLTTNLVFQTVTFPAPVAYPDSYLNDVRFDLRPDQSGLSGDKGVAYITDSSSEGRNGIIVVDLTSGNSWRHLNNYPRVRPLEQVVPFVWGEPVYSVPSPGMPISTLAFGTDGNALGADGNDFYFKTISGRYLYSVPTERLRDNSATSELLAQSSLVNRGESGVSDGLETDSNGLIYAGNVEQGSISVYNPQNGTVSTFVRDPRLNWIDTMSVATDGYIYFTSNQLNFAPMTYPGTERRERPFVLFRAKLPNNGTKISP